MGIGETPPGALRLTLSPYFQESAPTASPDGLHFWHDTV